MIPLAIILAAALFADHGRRMGAHHSRHQRRRSPSGNQSPSKGRSCSFCFLQATQWSGPVATPAVLASPGLKPLTLYSQGVVSASATIQFSGALRGLTTPPIHSVACNSIRIPNTSSPPPADPARLRTA